MQKIYDYLVIGSGPGGAVVGYHLNKSGADVAILTDDNPRQEDPSQIIREILDGFQQFENFEVERDREKAIHLALAQAGQGDCVVIAGKGHEKYQIVGEKRYYFDDSEVAKAWLRKRPMVAAMPMPRRRAA